MGIKIIAKNKRASYDYFLEEKFEAGMVLTGTEVKSLRNGKVSINESHITIDNNMEIWANNIIIAHYEFGNIHNVPENRKRKLLLNSAEIKKIAHTMATKKLTLVPTMIYFKGSRVKLEIALGKGKKKFDKRADEAKKDVNRKLKRGLFED
ncbi:MAG: SsrA-binding protein SmpB [Deltaproteobacteria bacterium]|nr:MAG: SsrA-binding protein SmpB [Deltaproteobacteria bacterium]